MLRVTVAPVLRCDAERDPSALAGLDDDGCVLCCYHQEEEEEHEHEGNVKCSALSQCRFSFSAVLLHIFSYRQLTPKPNTRCTTAK